MSGATIADGTGGEQGFLLLPALPAKYRTMPSGYREDAPVTKTMTAAIGREIWDLADWLRVGPTLPR